MKTYFPAPTGQTAGVAAPLKAPSPPQQELIVTPGALTFDTLQSQKPLSATSKFSGALNTSSSNAHVAVIEPAQITTSPNVPVSFTVTALSLGTAVITIADKKGNEAQVDVIVKGWTMEIAPTWRINLAAGAVSDILYIAGGIDLNAVPTNTVEAYDPATKQWSECAPMPTARQGLGAGAIDGILYAVGGMPKNGVYSDAVEAYNPQLDTWTSMRPLPRTAFGLAVAASDSVLYAVGGYSAQSGLLNTLFAYDPVSDGWTERKPMPTARWSLAAGVINGILYAVGGAQIGSNQRLDTVEAYDPETDSWTSIKPKPMPTARNFLGAAVHDGKLYALGGADSSGQPLTTVEVYDPATDTWSTETPMPSTLDGLAAAAIQHVLYVRDASVLYSFYPV